MRVFIYVLCIAHCTEYHTNLNKEYGNIHTSLLGKYEFAKLKAILIMQQECFSYEKQLLDVGKKVVFGPCRNFGLQYDQLGVIHCLLKLCNWIPLTILDLY